MTVSKNLNDVSIFIVPLLDDNITQSDLSEESGFVNAYTNDINRPYLYDNIFLMYKSSANTIESMNRFKKFKQLDTIHNTIYITINGEHYIVYTFQKVKNRLDVKNLLIGSKCIDLNSKLYISNFWGCTTANDLTYRLFLPHYKLGDTIEATFPEEDFYPYEL